MLSVPTLIHWTDWEVAEPLLAGTLLSVPTLIQMESISLVMDTSNYSSYHPTSLPHDEPKSG